MYFPFPVLRNTVYAFTYLLFISVTNMMIENRKKLLIKSAVQRSESTGVKCTPAEMTEMLTTQPSSIESKSDDVLLHYLEEWVEEIKIVEIQ